MSRWDMIANIAEAQNFAYASRSDIRRIQQERFIRQVDRVWQTNSFYRRIWQETGLMHCAINGLDDLPRIPVVYKEDFEADLLAHPPWGTYQGQYALARIQGSSGTTGEPKPFGITARDWKNIGILWARRLWAEGVRAEDRVQVAFAFALFIPGFSAVEGAMRLGATVVPTGSGAVTRSVQQLAIARRFRTSVLGATGSYAWHLAEVAEQEGFVPHQDLSFKLMFHTGEPLPESTRRALEDRWGCEAYDNYGSVETGAPTYQCSRHEGYHIMEDAYVFEILDPVTKEPVEPGTEGALVVTSLYKEAAPVVRHWTGDRARLLPDPCPCGDRFGRLQVLGRLDDMIKVRGVTVYPSAIEALLTQDFPWVADYRLILSRELGLDVLTLSVEACDNRGRNPKEVELAIEQRLNIRIPVEMWPNGRAPWAEIRETATKIRRIHDHRSPVQEVNKPRG